MAMYISLFDIFKVGLGPSSSHTVGPMRAAALFVASLEARDLLARTQRIHADLYGSLALTGRGHATDSALLLGLEGHRPDEIDPEFAQRRVEEIRAGRRLLAGGKHEIAFDDSRDIAWRMDEVLERHSNGMRFTAFDERGEALLARTYFSIGSQVMPKLCSMAISAACSISSLLPLLAATKPAAAIEHATPTSPWQPTSAPEIEAFIL